MPDDNLQADQQAQVLLEGVPADDPLNTPSPDPAVETERLKYVRGFNAKFRALASERRQVGETKEQMDARIAAAAQEGYNQAYADIEGLGVHIPTPEELEKAKAQPAPKEPAKDAAADPVEKAKAELRAEFEAKMAANEKAAKQALAQLGDVERRQVERDKARLSREYWVEASKHGSIPKPDTTDPDEQMRRDMAWKTTFDMYASPVYKYPAGHELAGKPASAEDLGIPLAPFVEKVAKALAKAPKPTIQTASPATRGAKPEGGGGEHKVSEKPVDIKDKQAWLEHVARTAEAVAAEE